jgi:hypothetical protein
MIEGKLRGDSDWTPLEETISIAELDRRYKVAYFKTKYTENPASKLTVINPTTKQVECEYREKA